MSTDPAIIRLLITPLNWGLGHATRSLALAQALRAAAVDLGVALDIHWASDGAAAEVLARACPEDALHELPGARVRYPTCSMSVNMLLMGPRLGLSILAEELVLRRLQRKHGFDLIISDNRFGCHLAGVPSWVLTHQVHLPLDHDWLGRAGKALNHFFLRRFDRVLVPDYPAPDALSGAMSAPLSGRETTYLGPLSQFSAHAPQGRQELAARAGLRTAASLSSTLAVVLSGPEPARSKFEAAVLAALPELGVGTQVFLVRGLFNQAQGLENDHLSAIAKAGVLLEIHDYLGTTELQQVLAKADVILTRSGYTTVMDLDQLRLPAIYVPTPGQPEQEVLAEALAKSGRGWELREAQIGRRGVLAEAVRVARAWEDGAGRLNNSLDLPAFAKTQPDLLAAWARDTLVALRTRTVNKL